MTMQDLMERIRQDLTKPHNPDNCGTTGCPAQVRYTGIYHEDETGWMLEFDQLLVWVYKSETTIDRDESTVSMSLCEAHGRRLV